MSDEGDLNLERHLSTFLTTNLAGKRKILQEHGDILLTERAEKQLIYYVERARRHGQSNLPAYEEHLRFLSECRRHGIVAVFAARERAKEIVRDDDTRAIAEQAMAVMNEGPGGKDQPALEQGAASIRRVLAIVVQIGQPQPIVEVKHALGTYLAELGKISGDRGYYHQAIEEFRSAVDLTSAQYTPVEQAKCQASLGQALWELGRLTGDRDNLNAAVSVLREAANALDRPNTRSDWMTAAGSLANALTALGEAIGGQQFLEEAIAIHRSTISVISRTDRPLTWALFKANLANSLRTLGELINMREAFDSAIVECEDSLKERLRERTPDLWADSKMILGTVFMNRGRLSQSHRDLESAVSAFRDAAHVRTRNRQPRLWADLHHNLGYALGAIGDLKNDRSTLEAAVGAYRSALLERTIEKRPRDWAMTSNSLAIDLRRLGTLTGQTDYFEQAAGLYRDALSVRTPDRDPLGHLETMRCLARLQMTKGAWIDASEILSDLLDVAKILTLGESDRANQRKLLGTLKGVGDELAYAYLKQGRVDDAALGALAARAILAENSKYSDRIDHIPELTAARDKWQIARKRANSAPSADTFVALRAAYHHVRAIYSASVDDRPLTANITMLRGAIPRGGAIVIVIICEEGGAVVTISSVADRPTVLWLSDVTWKWMYTLFHNRTEAPDDGWLGGYQKFTASVNSRGGLGRSEVAGWNKTIDRVLDNVGGRLMKPISQELERLGLRDGAEVVIAPPGALGLLPLHAAPIDSSRVFLDLWAVGYAPTASAIARRASAADEADSSSASLLAVTNPRGDLRIWENPAASEFSTDATLDLTGGKATIDKVVEEMKVRKYLSFYCHGTWDSVDPEESGLEMADEELLTVANLRVMDLSTCRLAVLGACESGVNDIRLAPDEFIGLPMTMIMVGVKCVVASLWTVEAEATASLIRRMFSLHLKEGLSPAAALRMAQLGLRDGSLQLSPSSKNQGVGTGDGEVRFTGPDSSEQCKTYYWGAFACYGG